MSDTSFDTITLGERIAGKWQVPAFALAVVVLGVAVANIKSPTRKIGIDANLAHLVRLNDAGMYEIAGRLADELLQWDDLTSAERGTIHLNRARAAFGRAERIEDHSPAAASAVIEAYEDASHIGAALTDRDFAKAAICFERLGEYQLAVKYHQAAAESAPPPALDHRQRVIELSAYPLAEPEERVAEMLDSFIIDADQAGASEALIWALGGRIEQLSNAKQSAAASGLLARYAARFADSPNADEFSYLQALDDWGNGRYDVAESRLRDLLNRVTTTHPLYARAAWLLGRTVMNDGRAQRPEEAIAIFRDVVSAKADWTYVTASRVAMAEALAELFRYDDALVSYRQAIDELGHLPSARQVNPDAVRSSLIVTAEQAQQRGWRVAAVNFLRLAVELIDPDDAEQQSRYLTRLADAQAAAGREILETCRTGTDLSPEEVAAQTAEANALLAEAADNQVKVAWLSTLNERRSATAMWAAASLFDECGTHGKAIELLRAFVRDRPDAEIIPRVLLRLGHSLQAEGRYREAIEAYQRDVSSFPRSAHANAALIPLAQCFMALGESGETDAENALRQIVEDSEIFTPAAAEYRDAMFLLGELYYRQGRYEEAIPVLEEALENYADDARITQARFQVADAYRKSALAIKAELMQPEFVGESKRLQVEFRSRLAQAAGRFQLLIEALEPQEADLSPRARMYLEDARLYEAAALFDLGQYAEALALYERAAWIYKDSPAALGAYVQVINCYIYLGREQDAEASLRRAQYLVETIDDARFAAESEFETRDGWREYFNWVADVLVATQ